MHPFDRTQSSQTEVNRVMAPFQNRKGNCSCMLSELLLSFKKEIHGYLYPRLSIIAVGLLSYMFYYSNLRIHGEMHF